MNSDLKYLLRNLVDFQVRFLVVGGVAVIRYTEPRYAKDLDVLIENSADNAKRLIAALKAFGAPTSSMTPDDFTTDDGFFQIGVKPNRINIINRTPGVEFAAAFERRELVKIGNLDVPFISREISGRPSSRFIPNIALSCNIRDSKCMDARTNPERRRRIWLGRLARARRVPRRTSERRERPMDGPFPTIFHVERSEFHEI